MSNIAFLQNLDAATKLPDGSIEGLMTRIAKVQKGMSEIEKTKLDALLGDAFLQVSHALDMIEQGSGNFLPNQRRRVEHGFKLPKASD